MVIRNANELESVLGIDRTRSTPFWRIFTIDTRSNMLVQIRTFEKEPTWFDALATCTHGTAKDVVDFVNKQDWTSGQFLLCVDWSTDQKAHYFGLVPHSEIFGENVNEG